MTNYRRKPGAEWVAAMCAAWICARAFGAEPFVPPRAAAVPGGVFLAEIPGPAGVAPHVTFKDKQVLVVRQHDQWLAVVGIPLDVEPGSATLEIANAAPRTFEIRAKEYAVQPLKVPPSQVNLSPEDEARVASETEKVRAALDAFTPHAPATLRLLQPIPGRR